MVHIPQDRMLPQDMVEVWELSKDGSRKVLMHAVDARHAMRVSPEIYVLDLPAMPEKPAKPEKKVVEKVAEKGWK